MSPAASCIPWAGATEVVSFVIDGWSHGSGGWLLLDAPVTTGEPGGQVSVIIQPAGTPEIATLIAEAYGLSKRERDVTRLVLCGFSTREIGEELEVSPYTVQDHLKAIFEKVGVGSRRELVAQLFLQHYAPRLQTASRIEPNGWFADDSLIAPRRAPD